MRCNKCGFENSEESIYCQNCNSFLEVNNQNNIVQPVYTNVENTMPEQPVYTNVENTVPEQPVNTSVENTIPEQPVYTSVENTIPQQPVYTSVENTIPQQPVYTSVENTIPEQPVYTNVENNIDQPMYTNIENNIDQPVYLNMENNIDQPMYTNIETNIPEQPMNTNVENTIPEQPVYPSVENTIPDQPMNTNIENNIEPQVQNNPEPEVPSQNITNNFNNQNSNSPIQKILENKKMLGLVLLGIVVVILVIVLFPKGNKVNKKFDLERSDSFFLKDGEKYVLFNKNGKRLNDNNFDDAESFKNGVSIVELDGKYGVIDEKGKMVVPFDTYKEITSSAIASVFEVKQEDGKKRLINKKGEKIFDGSFQKLASDYNKEISAYLVHNSETKTSSVLVINYEGKIIDTIQITENDYSKDFQVSTSDNILSLYFKGTDYLYDARKGKLLTKFESENFQCPREVSDDGNSFVLLSPCKPYSYSLYSSEEKEYSLYTNNKIYNYKGKCFNIEYETDYLGNDEEIGYYKCNNKEGYLSYALFDSKMEPTIDLDDVQMINSKTYALYNYEEKSVGFYKNGKLSKKVENIKIEDGGYTSQYYRVEITSGNKEFGSDAIDKQTYYDTNGNKLFNNTYKEIGNFDNNNLAEIEEGSYYEPKQSLINKKGEKITEEYENVLHYGKEKNYVVKKDDKYGVINTKGKNIIDLKYEDFMYGEMYDEKYFYIFDVSDKKREIYRATDLKLILSTEGKVEFKDNYFYVEKDNTIEYYTETGKKFYEIKK